MGRFGLILNMVAQGDRLNYDDFKYLYKRLISKVTCRLEAQPGNFLYNIDNYSDICHGYETQFNNLLNHQELLKPLVEKYLGRPIKVIS